MQLELGWDAFLLSSASIPLLKPLYRTRGKALLSPLALLVNDKPTKDHEAQEDLGARVHLGIGAASAKQRACDFGYVRFYSRSCNSSVAHPLYIRIRSDRQKTRTELFPIVSSDCRYSIPCVEFLCYTTRVFLLPI